MSWQQRVFLCLPSAVWPFPLAKPLAFRGTLNKGCVSLVPTATEAPAVLFIERETEVHYFPQPSTWAWSLRTSAFWRDNRHDLTPEKETDSAVSRLDSYRRGRNLRVDPYQHRDPLNPAVLSVWLLWPAPSRASVRPYGHGSPRPLKRMRWVGNRKSHAGIKWQILTKKIQPNIKLKCSLFLFCSPWAVARLKWVFYIQSGWRFNRPQQWLEWLSPDKP